MNRIGLTSNIQQFGLILYWVLTSAIGGMAMAITFPLIFAEAFQGFLEGTPPTFALIGAPLAGAFGGGLAGLLQWLILRRRIPGSNGWVLLTIVGWAAGLSVGIGLFLWLVPEGLDLPAILLPTGLAGLIAAAAQWRVLRNSVTGALWWLGAGATGWMLGLIVSLGLWDSYADLLTTSPGLFILIPGGIFGAILGFQTGFALVVLLSYSPIPVSGESGEVPDL